MCQTFVQKMQKKFQLKADGKCPRCECVVDVSTFRDATSRREFEISGYCQACQDLIFKEY